MNLNNKSAEKKEGYESFPLYIVFLANVVTVLIYGLGFYILIGISIWIGILYLLYCIWIEFMILKRSCVSCYYYDKFCGLGKGKLAPLFFKKGDPKKICSKRTRLVHAYSGFYAQHLSNRRRNNPFGKGLFLVSFGNLHNFYNHFLWRHRGHKRAICLQIL